MSSRTEYHDVIVVGAGFGGIAQLHELLKLNLDVKVIDLAPNVGGTWYWNTYPGALSDSEAWIYRYSWDRDANGIYPLRNRYVTQPEVLAYLEYVVDKHGFRKYLQLDTELRHARFDEKDSLWRISTTRGELSARYLVTALGILSSTNIPDIPGLKQGIFGGEIYHTARFPKIYDLSNKRVGVIGCGSTGVQCITAIAPIVKSLICFQRRPQYTTPANDGPVSQEKIDWVRENYDEMWKKAQASASGMAFEEAKVSALSVSEDERNRIYEDSWSNQNGLHFQYATFNDVLTDLEANKTACDFIRNKIKQIVKDPEKGRKLTPLEPHARRALSDSGYYEVFNQSNVDIVDLKTNPIVGFAETGPETSDGTVHKLDVLILATGFEAVDGSYKRLHFVGRRGETLADHWSKRLTSYLGTSVPNFPNLMMLNGPLSGFSNIPPALEAQAKFIAGLIDSANRLQSQANGVVTAKLEVEATPDAEARWVALSDEYSTKTLFYHTASWFYGDNVEGKKRQPLFFMAGLAGYIAELQKEVSEGYPGYKISQLGL